MGERSFPRLPCKSYVIEQGVRVPCARQLYHLGGHEYTPPAVTDDAPAASGLLDLHQLWSIGDTTT
jgi:hypothetical protein